MIKFTHRQEHLFRTLVLILAGLFISNSASTKEPPSHERIDTATRKVAVVLAGKMEGRVCVLDFVELADPSYSSEMGKILAESLSDQLSNQKGKKFEIVARRELVQIVRDSMVFGDDKATFNRLQKEAQMDFLVSGNYSETGDEILVHVKSVSAQSGQVTGASTFSLPKTDSLLRMLRHRFKAYGESDKATDGQALLEVETGVFYEGGDGKLYPVRDGMVLASKDNYAIYLRPQKSCYFYVYQVDSTQKAFRLFPNNEFSQHTNPVREGEEVWVPEKGFLFLDENPGQEDIFVFATKAPATELENIKEMNLAGLQDSIKTMGVGGKRGSDVVRQAKGTQGSGVELITRRLSSNGDFFYQIAFIHR